MNASDVYVDFDGTISPSHFPDPLIEPPNPTVLETIKSYKKRGFRICIWSCRTNPEVVSESVRYTAEMEDWLKKHNVPYDIIIPNKPLFHILIDDRAINPRHI